MKQDDGKEEDFCSTCLNIVYNIDQYQPRVYVFEDQCDPLHVPETYSE